MGVPPIRRPAPNCPVRAPPGAAIAFPRPRGGVVVLRVVPPSTYLPPPPPLESSTTVLRVRLAAKSASRRATVMAAMENGRRRDNGDENINNQLATGAMDGATATQRWRQWMARPATAMEQCVEWTGNFGTARDARWRRRDKR